MKPTVSNILRVTCLATAVAWGLEQSVRAQAPAYMLGYTNTFATDLGRWTTVQYNDTYPANPLGNDFGWRNSALAGGTAGEAGGRFHQTPNTGTGPAYVADNNLNEGGVPLNANVMPLRLKARMALFHTNRLAGVMKLGYTVLSTIGTSEEGYFGLTLNAPDFGASTYKATVSFLNTSSPQFLLPADSGTLNRYEVDLQWEPIARRVTGTVGTNVIDFTVPLTLSIAYRAQFDAFAMGTHGAGVPSVPSLTGWYADEVAYNLAPSPWTEGAPTDLAGSSTNFNRVDLTWTDNAVGESGFVIERSEDNFFYKLAGYAAANATSFTDLDNTLYPLTSYSYRVRAYKPGQVTEPSAPISVQTGPGYAPPAVPKSFAAWHYTPNNVICVWVNADSPAGDQNAGFAVERLMGANWRVVGRVPYDLNVNPNYTFYDTNVTDGGTYTYRVAATNGAGVVSAYRTNTVTLWPQYLGIVDPFEGFTKMVSQTGWQIFETDAADPWDQDVNLAERTSDAANAEMVYRLSSEQVTTFALKLFYQTALWNAAKLKFYVSADGSSYTEVGTTVGDVVDKGGGWSSAMITPAAAIPAGNTYLKIVALSGFGSASAIRLSHLVINPPLLDDFNDTSLWYASQNAEVANIRDVSSLLYENSIMRIQTMGSGAPAVQADYYVPGVKGFSLRFEKSFTQQNWPVASDYSNLRVYVSPDAFSWTEVPKLKTRDLGPFGANLYRITEWVNDTQIPDGNQYLRLEWPGYNPGFKNIVGALSLSISTNAPVAPPAAPSGLTATAVSESQINLSWTDNSDNETSFRIERSPDNATWTRIDIVLANVTTYTNTGLLPNTLYYYRVKAGNSGGESDYSNVASATTWAEPPPAAPSGLTATPVRNQINLSWTDNATNELGFKIERKIGAGGTWIEIGRTRNPNVTFLPNKGLKPETAYYYRVRAFNVVGDSDYSNEANATTLARQPEVFEGLPRTGQITSYTNVVGDDGSLQKGLAWPDPRFADNGDGTVSDNLTGLIWLKNTNPFNDNNVAPSNAVWRITNEVYDGQYGLSDGSAPGDWRLPNINELQSLLDCERYNPKMPLGHPFTNVYLSSTRGYLSGTRRAGTMGPYIMALYRGHSGDGSTGVPWPVRGESNLPKTGNNTTVTPGDDGDLQKGVAWPEPRFTDNNNGTVTDNLTGLVWYKTPGALGLQFGTNAFSICATLADGQAGLSDGSRPGDWRMPNLFEFRSLIDYQRTGVSLPLGHPFTVPSGQNWRISTRQSLASGVQQNNTYSHNMVNNGMGAEASLTSGTMYFWPVRDAAAPAVAARFTGMAWLGGGTLQLTATGGVNQVYVLQAATNLTPTVTWTPIATNTASGSGVVTFVDSNAGSYPVRFSRAVR